MQTEKKICKNIQKYSKIFKKVLDILGDKSIIMHITALLYTLFAI